MTDRPTTIIRAKRSDTPYFMMTRATAQDDSLSWAARGVLTYLLSKPDDWRVNIKDLQQGCGRDKVYNLIDELIAHRYMERSKTQSVDYIVHEVPLPENTEVKIGLPEIPDPEIPYTAFQDTYIVENKEHITESTDKTLATEVAPAKSPAPIVAVTTSAIPALKEVPKSPPSSDAPPVDKRNMHQRGIDAYYDNLPPGVCPKIKSYGGQVGNGIKALLKEYSPEQIGIATAEAYRDEWWSTKANTPIPVQTLGQSMEILLRKAKFNGHGTPTERGTEAPRTNGLGTGVLASNTLTPEQELEYRQHLRRIAERQMSNVPGHAVDNKKRAG